MPVDKQRHTPSHIMQKTIFDFHNGPLLNVHRANKPAPVTTNHHFHDFYEIYYLVSGERFYFIKDTTYHIKSGTLVIINPYDVHYTDNYADYTYDRILINFNKEILNEFLGLIDDINPLECYKKDLRVIKLNPQEQHYVESILNTMLKEYGKMEAGFNSYLKTSLLQLLIFMSRRNSSAGSDDINYINSAHKTISEITGYINTNFSADITLSHMSERFFISPCHLSRIFKQITGFAFTEYVNGIRIKEAQKLLCSTDLPIAEITEIVGYKSNTHFGRMFKSITGTTPIIYRKAHTAPHTFQE